MRLASRVDSPVGRTPSAEQRNFNPQRPDISPKAATRHGLLESLRLHDYSFDTDTSSSDDEFYTPRSSIASHTALGSTVATSSEADPQADISSKTVTAIAETSLSGTYTDQDWLMEATQSLNARPLSRSAPNSRSSSPSKSEPSTNSIRGRPRMKPRQHSHKKSSPSILMSMTAVLETEDDLGPGPRSNGKGYVAYAPQPQSHVIHTRRKSLFQNPLVEPGSRYPDLASNSSRPHSPIRSSPLRPVDPTRPRSRSLGRISGNSLGSSSAEPYTSTNSSHLPSIGTAGYTSLTLPRAPMPSGLSRAPSVKVKAKLSSNGKVDLTTSGVAQTTMTSIEVITGLSSLSSSSRRKFWPSTTLRKSSSSHRVNDASPLAFTSHRPPPSFVSSSQVLVQVWAVGVDATDGRSLGLRLDHSIADPSDEREDTPVPPAIGFIPGRSFVGRILECGFDTGDYEDRSLRKGEWVIGLCDIRKGGCLAEFITIDRHRVFRVPHPMIPSVSSPQKSSSLQHQHTLEQLALLPLIGIPAYRAVKSLSLAFGTEDGLVQEPNLRGSSSNKPRLSHLESEPTIATPSPLTYPRRHRRALILRGSSALGLLLLQMLTRRGWQCVAHASLPINLKGEAEVKRWMKDVERRVSECGAMEVVFDDGDADGDDDALHNHAFGKRKAKRPRGERQPILRVIERLKSERCSFDVVLDTVGGKDVWKASADLLTLSQTSHKTNTHERSVSETIPPTDGKESVHSAKTGFLTIGGHSSSIVHRLRPSPSTAEPKQFITLIGDRPLLPQSTPKQRFKANLRSIHNGSSMVGYVWVSIDHDVDFEGSDVADSLEAFMSSEARVYFNERKLDIWVEGYGEDADNVVGFEQAPSRVFREGSSVLKDGGVCVIRIVP